MERHKSQQLSQIYRADDAEFQSASAPPRESAGLGLHARYGMGALMISIEVPWFTPLGEMISADRAAIQRTRSHQCQPSTAR